MPTLAKPLPVKAELEDFLKLSGSSLLALSKEYGWSLNRPEMELAQKYFGKLGRPPSRGEMETIAQTWSEHCKHKTFSGPVKFTSGGRTERIPNLFKETIVKATRELDKKWCLSVFEDNAGVVEFGKGGKWALAFKAETHNHPCALEPYGGSETGVGGVIRDVLGVGLGAKPVLNTDIFCFAPPGLRENLPQSALAPERVLRGVVTGVRDYGNRMGIPTAAGAVCFDKGYMLNPLVFVGTVGIMPRKAVHKEVRPGDLIVCAGGRTGRDGIHGATFSSADIDEDSPASAVQIGHPLNEKRVLDAQLKARDRSLYRGVTDCGAGGFSSAIGELGAETGARVYLERAPLKDAAVLDWEIWVSESQERMIYAVPPGKLREFENVFAGEGCQTAVLGEFSGKRLCVTYNGKTVVDLDMEFLHGACPKIEKPAVWKPAKPRRAKLRKTGARFLEDMLANLNICSREFMIRQYDHEVQGGTVLKPLSGANGGPQDGCVIWPHAATGDTRDYCGFAAAHGINPAAGKIDPYEMALQCADEAMRGLACMGADVSRAALLDNFCWGSPENKTLMGALVLAARGCYDAAKAYQAPFISGKDSFYNQAKDARGRNLAIPCTLLVSAVAPVEDVRRTISSDLKRDGSALYILGATRDDIGPSVYREMTGISCNSLSKTDAAGNFALYKALAKAMGRGLVLSAHDCSQGGLAVCAAEMAFAGGIGAEIVLDAAPYEGPGLSPEMLLYSETSGRILLEVSPQDEKKFLAAMKGFAAARIGRTGGKELGFVWQGAPYLAADIERLRLRWQNGLVAALEGK
ncbi:MAG: phosphoribosylformylglycinamidine synthase subunit PurL [Elusimicrobiales bacterium]